MTTVLIDGNNFYASCEQAMDPSLNGRPLVVLSNNDGCVIARSAEAKSLKIRMGQPFFKIDNSRNLNEQGSGLGLSIANELVKKLNGNIIITASKKLKGSCFTIKLQDLQFL